MTGSVSSESHSAQPPNDKAKSEGKSDAESEQTVDAKEAHQQNDSPSSTSKDFDKASKNSLPPLTTESQPRRTSSTSQLTAASPKASRKVPTFSSTPAKNMDEGTNTLNRYGKAQSFLTLCNTDDDERSFVESESMSELGGPVSARRRRGEPRGYGTLERATSYSSLTMRPLFRSANSVPPRPAPPCTTTHLDYSRHPGNPAANSRLVRRGTPRANNPHPVGLYFQSPYNKDGKVMNEL